MKRAHKPLYTRPGQPARVSAVGAVDFPTMANRRSTTAAIDEVVPRPRMWIVRHGLTEWAANGRHTGRTDIPLTDVGRAQAAALAGRLAGVEFAEVRSSPLSRALDTARLAGFGDRVITDPDLMEWDYGADEGRTGIDLRAERPGWTIWRTGVRDGETIDDVAARADRAITRARAMKGDTLCFAHGHVLRVVGARWIGLPPVGGENLALGTASISVLGWDRAVPIVSRWNVGPELD